MPVATFAGIVMGCILGTSVGYYFMRPFTSATALRTTVLDLSMLDMVQLRGELVTVDFVSKTLTVNVIFPGFREGSAPFKIPYSAVQNYANYDEGSSVASEPSRVATAKVGQLVTMRMLRQPGLFKVLSLSTHTPTDVEL